MCAPRALHVASRGSRVAETLSIRMRAILSITVPEPVANNNCNTYYKSVPNALQYIVPRFTLQYKATNSAVPYKAVHQKLKLS